MTSICLGNPILLLILLLLLLLPTPLPLLETLLQQDLQQDPKSLTLPPPDSLATGFPLHVAKPQTLSHKPLNFLILFFSHIKTWQLLLVVVVVVVVDDDKISHFQNKNHLSSIILCLVSLHSRVMWNPLLKKHFPQ